MAITVAVVVTATASDPAQAQSSGQPRVLGAFIGKDTVDDTTTATADPTLIDTFANNVGAQPAVVMLYQNWERTDRRVFNPQTDKGTGMMDEVASRGAMPMVTWTPQDPDLGTNQPEYALRAIIAGDHDEYIRQWALDARAWGKPFYLRFAHEMNGKWQPWSPGSNGNTTAEYVAAWRHVHGIFEEVGATNVRWVWSPYVSCGNCTAFKKVYPGDAYVDWVALDGYNWGNVQPRSRWQSMNGVFGSSYDAVTRLAPSKPFMIAEVASTEKGGNKAAWIRDAFSKSIPNRMPKTRAIVWFSNNKETDWRVNSSDVSLAAYRNVATNPSYQGKMP